LFKTFFGQLSDIIHEQYLFVRQHIRLERKIVLLRRQNMTYIINIYEKLTREARPDINPDN